MPDDVPTGHDPRDHEFARWLHALAEMVERNPDLAELVRRRAAETPGTASPQLETDALPDHVNHRQEQADCDAAEIERDGGTNGHERDGRDERVMDGRDESCPYNDVGEDASALPTPSADGEQGSHGATGGAGVGPLLRHTRRSSRYGPPSVSGRPPELGTGIPDPFAIFARDGAEGLRSALETLRIGSLRAIIRAHNLDPQGKLSASATEKRLITAIVSATERGKQRT